MKENVAATLTVRETQLRRSANRRYYKEDFTGLNLSNSDFRHATILECDFTDVDLSYSNFENTNCWGSKFEGTNLYRVNMKDAVLASTIMHPKDCFGMTLTLTCDAVDKMDINEKFWMYWLYMATMFKPPSEDHRKKLIDAIGEDSHKALQRLFKERQF